MHLPDTHQIGRRFKNSLLTYNDAAIVQRRMAQSLCTLLSDVVGRDGACMGDVLELGCGTGLLTQAFAGRFSWQSLKLMDLVPEHAACHAGWPRAHFSTVDLNDCASYPACDLILAGAVFQWITDLETLFGRLACALREGGRLAFSTFAPGNLEEIASITQHGLPYPTCEELMHLLHRAGLRCETSHAETQREYFDSPQAVLRHLKATGVTANTRKGVWTRAHLNHFESGYEAFKEAEGRFPLTYRPLYVIARKEALHG